MSELLPQRERVAAYHYACPESKAMIECLTDASLEAKAALADVANQFFVQTATWSLDAWENQVGLPTDNGQTLSDRRAAVAKRLLSSGNTTAETVRELAENFTGRPLQLVDHHDYSFSLKFLEEGVTLLDIDSAGLRDILEQVKPAHLRFDLGGITWAKLEARDLIWQWFEDHPTTWWAF